MESTRIRNFEKLISDLGFNEALKAFDLMRKEMGEEAGFMRQGGEPYYYHLVDVSQFLLNWGIRDETIITSALLHDFIEDVKGANHSLVQTLHGKDVADVVLLVTKKHGVDYKTDMIEMQKYVDGISEDFRSALVKTGDLVHNFGTLGDTPLEKRLRKAKEMEMFYFPFLEKCATLYPRYSNLFLGAKTTIEPHLKALKAHAEDMEKATEKIRELQRKISEQTGY